MPRATTGGSSPREEASAIPDRSRAIADRHESTTARRCVEPRNMTRESPTRSIQATQHCVRRHTQLTVDEPNRQTQNLRLREQQQGGSAFSERLALRRCEMDFEVTREHGAGRLIVRGEIDLSVEEDLIAALRMAAIDGGDVLVDLAELSFMDSTGIHAFGAMAKQLQGRGRLVLIRPRGIVAK